MSLPSQTSNAARSFAASVIDEKTEALMRVAATIAVDAVPSSFQHAVTFAFAVGRYERRNRRHPRGRDPGHRSRASRPVRPKLALALGYDVEEALELARRGG